MPSNEIGFEMNNVLEVTIIKGKSQGESLEVWRINFDIPYFIIFANEIGYEMNNVLGNDQQGQVQRMFWFRACRWFQWTYHSILSSYNVTYDWPLLWP